MQAQGNMQPVTGAARARKNLAVDLLDKKVRKQYLHTEKHRMPDILKAMYRPVLKSKRIAAASIGYALTDGILPLLSVFILSGKTALFISHRLASTRFCDRIILLDGGRIAQQGTHEELVNEKGLYQSMFLTQGKYYQEQAEEVMSSSLFCDRILLLQDGKIAAFDSHESLMKGHNLYRELFETQAKNYRN